jgi:hypothetical protein
MEIGSNFEWTGVNWTYEYFPNNLGLSFKVLKIKQGKDDGENNEEASDRTTNLICMAVMSR